MRDPTSGEVALLPPSLPRRDLFLLPFLVVSTLVVLFLVCEGIARVTWIEKLSDACAVIDPAFGVRHTPNCKSSVKLAEGPWVEYRYNDCGARSNTACQPKPDNTFRIALLGASVSHGSFVPYDETFAARAALGVSQILHKPAETQNFGVYGLSIGDTPHQVDPALALQPDLAILLLSPIDILTIDRLTTTAGRAPSVDAPKADAPPPLFSLHALKKMADSSRAIAVAKHFLYFNRETALRLYILQGDKTDHLHLQYAPIWKKRFEKFDVLLSQMATRLRSYGIPLVIMPVPSRPQAAILSSGSKFPGIDPWLFGVELRASAEKAGVDYIDTLPEFARTPGAERFFYVSDGHPNGEGNILLAEIFVNEMKRRGIPTLLNPHHATEMKP